MPTLLWDASALAKRYVPETGSKTVGTLFASMPLQMVTTLLGYAETFSLLLRKMNGGGISITTFTTAVSALQIDLINAPDVTLLSVEDAMILSGIPLMRRHNINATDAAILAAFVRYAQADPATTTSCVLVAADKRLVRAAAAEGLNTLNPELLPAADVPAFLADL